MSMLDRPMFDFPPISEIWCDDKTTLSKYRQHITNTLPAHHRQAGTYADLGVGSPGKTPSGGGGGGGGR